MSVIIFIIILSVLVFAHELGHFSVAKFFGIRVDEFGLGFPPRAKKMFTWKGTLFTLNWLPFGGFVKIFGENPNDSEDTENGNLVDENGEVKPQGAHFASKNRGVQAAVLVAGVVANFIFAWLLISLGFMTGLPAPAGLSYDIENPRTVITTIMPGSPAAEAGLRSGDAIISLSRDGNQSSLAPGDAALFIGESSDPIMVSVERGDEHFETVVIPEEGIVPDRRAIGISMDIIGVVQLPIHEALWQGLKVTTELTLLTAKALGSFIGNAVIGQADLSQVTGPVGLAGMVGDARTLGFAYLLSLTALISINLAIVNLMPFPALDGGRLLFVAIESIIRRPIPSKVFNALNTVGFSLLILLMLVVTFRDIVKLV